MKDHFMDLHSPAHPFLFSKTDTRGIVTIVKKNPTLHCDRVGFVYFILLLLRLLLRLFLLGVPQ